MLPDSSPMAAALSPLRRFFLHSLWVVLPFCVLTGLSWNAWRADAETRRSRLLEVARASASQDLQVASARLGEWSPVPRGNIAEDPPLPDGDPASQAARSRYEAGDYEGVLGSPASARSAAGLPLRSLAAVQLLRREADPARLVELARVLTGSPDFMSPIWLAEAEGRFVDLKIPVPESLAGWRERWRRMETEAALAQQVLKNGDHASARWADLNDVSYLVELREGAKEWRVRHESEVRAAAAGPESRLADGLGIAVRIGGKSVAGPVGKSSLVRVNFENWQADVVLADQDAYQRGERRTRDVITGVITVSALAVAFGLILAGRAYLRAVELARRQSEFMAAVSHEMRTPLAAMQLLAENLESGVADRTGQSRDHTRMIREECARLGELVGNVLAFTRGGKSEPHEVFNVSGLVSDAASLVKPLAEKKGIDFQWDVADFPEPPAGDVEALRRALLNLLDNAVKHTPGGGAVKCQTHPDSESRWIIKVSDSGPGIPPGERKRIFEPFYRIGTELRRGTPGTGLGLALVLRTANAHAGRVEVSDAEGGGAVFTLILPIHPARP